MYVCMYVSMYVEDADGSPDHLSCARVAHGVALSVLDGDRSQGQVALRSLAQGRNIFSAAKKHTNTYIHTYIHECMNTLYQSICNVCTVPAVQTTIKGTRIPTHTNIHTYQLTEAFIHTYIHTHIHTYNAYRGTTILVRCLDGTNSVSLRCCWKQTPNTSRYSCGDGA